MKTLIAIVFFILLATTYSKPIRFDVERRYLTEDPIAKIHRLAKTMSFNDVDPITILEATREIDLTNFKDVQYFAPLYIGQDLQKMTFIFDTGSEWLWVPLDSCSNCRAETKYTPAPSFEDTGKAHNISYVSGKVEGSIASDEVRTQLDDPAVNMRLLAVTSESNIEGTQSDGILGLSPTSSDGSDLLVDKLYKEDIIDSKQFGVNINRADQQSTIILGGYDEEIVTGDFVHLSLHNDVDWWVPHTKVMIGDYPISSKGGLTVFDTGNSVTTFQSSIYYGLLTTIGLANDGNCFFQNYEGDNYYHCPCPNTAAYKDIEIHMRGYAFSIPPEGYIHQELIDNVNT